MMSEQIWDETHDGQQALVLSGSRTGRTGSCRPTRDDSLAFDAFLDGLSPAQREQLIGRGLARVANISEVDGCRVVSRVQRLRAAGETAAQIHVRLNPPRESGGGQS